MILQLGCHFLGQVKRNCRKLWETCALYTALARPISVFETYEEAHGHQLYRKVMLYDNQADLPQGWKGIERIVKVRRWGYRNKKAFEEVSFYILSKPLWQASQVAQALRGHWSIENKLHWAKDVYLGEDEMTLRDKQQVTILVYLNNVALHILRLKGWKVNKDTFAKLANKVYELSKIFD